MPELLSHNLLSKMSLDWQLSLYGKYVCTRRRNMESVRGVAAPIVLDARRRRRRWYGHSVVDPVCRAASAAVHLGREHVLVDELAIELEEGPALRTRHGRQRDRSAAEPSLSAATTRTAWKA